MKTLHIDSLFSSTFSEEAFRRVVNSPDNAVYFDSLNWHLAKLLRLKDLRREPPVYGSGPRITFQPKTGRREVFSPRSIPEQWQDIMVFAIRNGVKIQGTGMDPAVVPIKVMDAVARYTGWKGVEHG